MRGERKKADVVSSSFRDTGHCWKVQANADVWARYVRGCDEEGEMSVVGSERVCIHKWSVPGGGRWLLWSGDGR